MNTASCTITKDTIRILLDPHRVCFPEHGTAWYFNLSYQHKKGEEGKPGEGKNSTDHTP